ncbi:MAG TPA: hypothetical protein VM686_10290 [Polyangiaceae bacterium]|jgi:hypothetical protein|nr:hypothetical protein [Polyangiaceae bacterium]
MIRRHFLALPALLAVPWERERVYSFGRPRRDPGCLRMLGCRVDVTPEHIGGVLDWFRAGSEFSPDGYLITVTSCHFNGVTNDGFNGGSRVIEPPASETECSVVFGVPAPRGAHISIYNERLTSADVAERIRAEARRIEATSDARGIWS